MEAKLFCRDNNDTFYPLFDQPVAVLSLNVTARSDERKEKRRKTETEAASLKYLSLEPNWAAYAGGGTIAAARIKSKKLPAARVEVLFPSKNPGKAKVRISIICHSSYSRS